MLKISARIENVKLLCIFFENYRYMTVQTTVLQWFQENVEPYHRLTWPQHIITYIWIFTLRILYFQVWKRELYFDLWKRDNSILWVMMEYIASNHFKYYSLKEAEIGIFHGLPLSLNVDPL